jgi:hypothetical protein
MTLIPQFCFPNGIDIVELAHNADGNSQLYKVLFMGSNSKRVHDSSVFLVKDEYSVQHMYCYSIVYPELLLIKNFGLVKSEIAFCVVTKCPYSDLFFKMLNMLHDIYMPAELATAKSSTIFNVYTEIIPKVLKEISNSDRRLSTIQTIISNVMNFKLESNKCPALSTLLDKYKCQDVKPLDFNCYLTLKGRCSAIANYFAPAVFSLLSLDAFYAIFASILLEKSVLFIGNNSYLLSAFKYALY